MQTKTVLTQQRFSPNLKAGGLLQGNVPLRKVLGIDNDTNGQESPKTPRHVRKDERFAILVVGEHGRCLGNMCDQSHADDLETSYRQRDDRTRKQNE